MFTGARKRAELFLSAHQRPLVQRGFSEHVNAAPSTARNSPGGAGDGWYPTHTHQVNCVTEHTVCCETALDMEKA